MTKRKDQIRLGAFLMATGHPTAQGDAGANPRSRRSGRLRNDAGA